MENQLLDAPVQELGHEDLVLRGARDLVHPSQLLRLLPRLAEHAEHLPVQAELVDAPRVRIRREQHLVGPRRDADRPGRARGERARLRVGVGLVADRGWGVRVERYVDGDGAQESAVPVEHLDPSVETIRDVDVAPRIGRDVVRGIEIAGLVAALAPRLDPQTVPVELRHPRVDVAIADVDVPRRIPGHVRHLSEAAVLRRQRRRGVLERAGLLVGRFLLAPEHHEHLPLRVELDDHVRTLVHGPDVVVLVDPDGVPEGPGVEVLADLAEERSARIELEQLGCRGGVRRAGGVAPRQHEDVSLGVEGDPGDLPEIEVRWKLQHVGHRLERDGGHRLLRERRRATQHARRDHPSLHGPLLRRDLAMPVPQTPAYPTGPSRPTKRMSPPITSEAKRRSIGWAASASSRSSTRRRSSAASDGVLAWLASAQEKLPQGRCSTVKASQLTIAPTTDMERPQINMSRKSLFLFALGPALAMNTAPVVESGERSTTKPHTMMDETSGRRSALDAPSCFRSGGAIGRKAGRITPVVLA